MFSIMVRALAMLQESECFVQGCILVQGCQPKKLKHRIREKLH